jgi:hypothetical protein
MQSGGRGNYTRDPGTKQRGAESALKNLGKSH